MTVQYENKQNKIDFETIIAHRGESVNCPENTLVSYKYAFELGADGLECDVQITKDNVPVIFHDRSLKNKTGEVLTINELTYSELMQRDVGIWKNPKWKGTRIPTLEQLLESLPAGKMLHLEFKCGADTVTLIADLMTQQKNILKQIVFTSFSFDVAKECKRIFPKTPFLINGMTFDFNHIIEVGAQGIAFWYDHELAKKAQSLNMMMRTGNINSFESAQVAYNDQIKCIDTDKLEEILRISGRIQT